MLVMLVAAVSPKTKVAVFLNDGKGIFWASDLAAPIIHVPAPARVS